MAIHVYVMLITLCVSFGTSFQQRQNLRKRLSRVETMVGGINMRTRVDISELQDAVEQLQNKSDENSLCDTDLSSVDPAVISHLESKTEQHDMKITVISKAVSDEKVYTWEKMNEIEQRNQKLAQQVKELATNWSQTKQRLTQQVKELTLNGSQTNQRNHELAQQVKELTTNGSKTKQTNNELTQQVKDIATNVLQTNHRLTQQVNKLTSNVLQTKQTNRRLRQQVGKLTSNVSQTKATNHELAQQVNALTTNVSQAKQTNRRLTQQVNKLTTDVLQTKQANQDLTQQVKKLVSDVSLAKQINDNLKEELTKVKSHQKATEQMNTKLNKQVEEVKEDILGLKNMFMKTQQNTEPGPSSTTTTTTPTQETTTEPEPSTSTVTVPEVELTCQDGWSKFQNTCYKLVRTKATWDEAKRRCADMSAILAEPDTWEKIRYLWQIVTIWIGGTDRQVEGTWIWSGSGRRMGSDLWGYRQPNSGNVEDDCLAMISHQWFDYSCTWHFRYICEKQANV